MKHDNPKIFFVYFVRENYVKRSEWVLHWLSTSISFCLFFSPTDKNELHIEPSITRDIGDKIPLEEKEIILNINDELMLADLPVHDSGGFQPVLTEEQSK